MSAHDHDHDHDDEATSPPQPDPSPSTIVPSGPRRVLFSIYYALGFPLRLSYRLVRNAFEERPYSLYDAFMFYLTKDIVEYFAWVPIQGRGNRLGPQSEEQRRKRLDETGAAWTMIPRIGAEKLAGHPVLTKWPGLLAQPFRRRAGTLLSVEGYWIGERAQLEQQPARPGEAVVLYLHSGYYLMGTGDPTPDAHRTPKDLFAALQAKAAAARAGAQATSPPTPASASASASKMPTSLLSIEYRKAGTASWPAPLLDAITAWHYLVDELHFAPNDIVVAGESAGSHLALSLTRYLIEQAGRGVEQSGAAALSARIPAANILLAPWADLTGSLNTHRAPGRESQPTDWERLQHRCWLPVAMSRQSRESVLPGLEDMPASYVQSVWVSPVAEFDTLYDTDGREVAREDIFKDWPRTCVVYSTNDMLLPNAVNLYDRMRAARAGAGAGAASARPSIAKSDGSYDDDDAKDRADVESAATATASRLESALSGLGHAEGDADLARIVLHNVPHAPWTLPPGIFERARQASVQAAAEWLCLGGGS